MIHPLLLWLQWRKTAQYYPPTVRRRPDTGGNGRIFTIDLAAGYQFKRFGVQVNVSNVTNEVNYLNPWAFNLFDVQPLRRLVLPLRYAIH